MTPSSFYCIYLAIPFLLLYHHSFVETAGDPYATGESGQGGGDQQPPPEAEVLERRHWEHQALLGQHREVQSQDASTNANIRLPGRPSLTHAVVEVGQFAGSAGPSNSANGLSAEQKKLFVKKITESREKIILSKFEISRRKKELEHLVKEHDKLQKEHMELENWAKGRLEMNEGGWQEQELLHQDGNQQQHMVSSSNFHQLQSAYDGQQQHLQEPYDPLLQQPAIYSQQLPWQLPQQSPLDFHPQEGIMMPSPQVQLQSGMMLPQVGLQQSHQLQPQFQTLHKDPHLTNPLQLQQQAEQRHPPHQSLLKPLTSISQESILHSIANAQSTTLLEGRDKDSAIDVENISESASSKDKRKIMSSSLSSADVSAGKKRKKMLYNAMASGHYLHSPQSFPASEASHLLAPNSVQHHGMVEFDVNIVLRVHVWTDLPIEEFRVKVTKGNDKNHYLLIGSYQTQGKMAEFEFCPGWKINEGDVLTVTVSIGEKVAEQIFLPGHVNRNSNKVKKFRFSASKLDIIFPYTDGDEITFLADNSGNAQQNIEIQTQQFPSTDQTNMNQQQQQLQEQQQFQVEHQKLISRYSRRKDVSSGGTNKKKILHDAMASSDYTHSPHSLSAPPPSAVQQPKPLMEFGVNKILQVDVRNGSGIEEFWVNIERRNDKLVTSIGTCTTQKHLAKFIMVPEFGISEDDVLTVTVGVIKYLPEQHGPLSTFPKGIFNLNKK